MKRVIMVVSHPETDRTLMRFQRARSEPDVSRFDGRQATAATERVSATREQRAQVDSFGEGGTFVLGESRSPRQVPR